MRLGVGLAALVSAALALSAPRPAAPADLDPPLVGMHELTDPTRAVAMQVPTGWAALGPKKDVQGALEHWAGTFSAKPGQNFDASVFVRVVPAYSRAALARWGTGWNRRGTVVDGSVRRRPGEAEEVRADPEWRRTVLIRFVEGEGRVFELAATANQNVFSKIEAHLRALFDTFKVLRRLEPFTPPTGYATVPDDARVVWTDVRDKKFVKQILTYHAAGWKAMGALLSGAPFDASRPLVVICDKDETFSSLNGPSAWGQGPPPHSLLDSARRAVIVRAQATKDVNFEANIWTDSMKQRCQAWFGGPTDWIENGMFNITYSALLGGGTPDKPGGALDDAQRKAAVARKRRLDEILELHWESLKGAEAWDHASYDAFAWHYFLRFGGGAKAYGARLATYLDLVRKDGDPTAAAAKAFEGVDFEAMRTEYVKWLTTWKW